MTSELGYDPHPELNDCRGTPIPPIQNPLVRSPRRWAIANRVWWHAPPWTVLRNASTYLWYVMDYAPFEDLRFTLHDVPEHLWQRALEQARPGDLSKGSYVLWSLVFDRMALGELCGWPATAHRLDYRMLANKSRQQLLARQTYRRGQKHLVQK